MGIIPAYAGSTSTHFFLFWSYSDHPRIRGEHFPHVHTVSLDMGSSPHTRGALDDFVGLVCQLGIIPAYAGSTFSSVVASSSPADHPRIRGEHILGEKSRHEKEGSSPHTRGARVGIEVVGEGSGIIPAYAGSTRACISPSTRSRDHPRIRGEHGGGRSGQREGSGSSPHTRGAPDPAVAERSDPGIIPAYAGSTPR